MRAWNRVKPPKIRPRPFTYKPEAKVRAEQRIQRSLENKAKREDNEPS